MSFKILFVLKFTFVNKEGFLFIICLMSMSFLLLKNGAIIKCFPLQYFWRVFISSFFINGISVRKMATYSGRISVLFISFIANLIDVLMPSL